MEKKGSRTKYVFSIIFTLCLIICFSVNTFADYVGVQGVTDDYDIDSSVGLNMLYSNGVWGSSTLGYISLDATPAPGSTNISVSDPLTMSRGDVDGIKSFTINTGYIRHVDTSYNGLVVDHGFGGGTLTSSQLSKMTLYSTQPIVYDIDLPGSGGMPLCYVKNTFPGSNNVYARISFNYIDSNGRTASYTTILDPELAALNGVQYQYFNLYSEQLTALFKRNAIKAGNYALIFDLSISFEYDRSQDPITDGSLGIYQYYPKKGYDDINSGDIRIVTIDKYSKALAQSSFNSGVIAGNEVDILGTIYTAVDGFLNADLFGSFSLGDIMSTMICVMVVVAFLKAFAGG